MPKSVELGIFPPPRETDQSVASIGWLARLQQYEEDAHSKFGGLYEKVARGARFPRGFTKKITESANNPWIWTSLSFMPSVEELSEVPQSLRMLLNDLRINALDKTEVEISFRTKKSEDGKPGEYDGDFSFEIRPHEITEDKAGVRLASSEYGFKVFSATRPEHYISRGPYSGLPMNGIRDIPSGRGRIISDFYDKRNPSKKLVSHPVQTEILKGAVDWIGNLLCQNQNEKSQTSNIDYGWIDLVGESGKDGLNERGESISDLFNLTDEVIPYEWGVTPAEKKNNGTLIIDVKPEDYGRLPETVENLLVDLGVGISTPLEIIIVGSNTLQLLPKAVSRDTLGIIFAINYDVDHRVIAPQIMRHDESMGFHGDYFGRGKEVQQGYEEMPRLLKLKIVNETLKWAQEILKNRKVSS